MAQPRVQLLGQPRLFSADGGQARLGKKGLALLAYLAAHQGRVTPRETLAELLWPGRFEEQARQSLRQALSAMRRGFGEAHAEALVSTDAGVGLDLELLTVDVVAFDRLAELGDPASLQAAAALYQGSFAEGLVRVSDEFDAWADDERRSRAARAVAVFDALGKLARSSGENEAALAHARRAVEIEPAHEPGHRMIMALLAESGQRAAALRQFETVRDVLARELDVGPDEETRALAETIRADAGPKAAPAEAASPEPASPANVAATGEAAAAPASSPADAATPQTPAETPPHSSAKAPIETPASAADATPQTPATSQPTRGGQGLVTPGRAFMTVIRYVRRRRLFIGLTVVTLAAAYYIYLLRTADRPPVEPATPNASQAQLASTEPAPTGLSSTAGTNSGGSGNPLQFQPTSARAPSPGPGCPVAQWTASTDPALIIAPFDYIGDDPALARFADAATDAVGAMSSAVPGVSIVAGPPRGHPDTALMPDELASANGASHVLTGTVRALNAETVVTLRLIDGETNQQIWDANERLGPSELASADAPARIAIRAARGVQEQLTDGRQALTYRLYEPDSLAVLEHATRGYGYLNETTEVYNELARGEFEAALSLDPDDEGALSGAGFSYILPLLFGWSDNRDADLAEAVAYADAALARAPEFSSALSLKGLTELFAGRHDAALEHGQRAVQLSGGGADATAFLAYIESYAGDPRDARARAEQALRLRPYTAPNWYAWVFARGLRLSGEPEAAAACLEADAFEPAGGPVRLLEMVQARYAAGETEAARELARTLGPNAAAADYCARPPYRDPEAEAACVTALTETGLR